MFPVASTNYSIQNKDFYSLEEPLEQTAIISFLTYVVCVCMCVHLPGHVCEWNVCVCVVGTLSYLL